MDHQERSMARARAEWRAKRAGKTSSSLGGFENWANEGTEGHHVARKKYGDQLIDAPISMHQELTRRQMDRLVIALRAFVRRAPKKPKSGSPRYR